MNTRTVGTLTQGTVLYQGRYRIDLLLTRTPHRAIYRAWDLTHNRAATLLELTPADDATVTTALERAAPLVKLDHATLLSFQVVFVEHDTVFIALTFAGGQTVEHIMAERATPIPPAAAVRWISQSEMLEYFASALPDWHLGDLSSSALFVTAEDRAQPIGFEVPLGLLTPAQVAADLPSGAVAPEMAQGRCDARADVYSLAATLHLLLTRQPWPGGDPASQTALDAVQPALPPPAIAAVRRALAVDPADRWSDIAAFHGALLAGMSAPAAAPAQDEWWLGAASQPLIEEPATLTTQRDDLTAALATEAAAQGSAPQWHGADTAPPSPADTTPDAAGTPAATSAAPADTNPPPASPSTDEGAAPPAVAVTDEITAGDQDQTASAQPAPPEAEEHAHAPQTPAPIGSTPDAASAATAGVASDSTSDAASAASSSAATPADTAVPAHAGPPPFVLPLAAASGAAIIAAVESAHGRRPSQPLAPPAPVPTPAPAETQAVPPAAASAPDDTNSQAPDAHAADQAAAPTTGGADLPQRADLGSAPDSNMITNALWGALTPDLLDNLAFMPPPRSVRGIDDVQPVLAAALSDATVNAAASGPPESAASAPDAEHNAAPPPPAADAAADAGSAPPVEGAHGEHGGGIGHIVLPVAAAGAAGAALLAAGAITHHAVTAHDHDETPPPTPTDATDAAPTSVAPDAGGPPPSEQTAQIADRTSPAAPAIPDVPPVAQDHPEPWLPLDNTDDWLTAGPASAYDAPDDHPSTDTLAGGTTPYGARGAWWDEPAESDMTTALGANVSHPAPDAAAGAPSEPPAEAREAGTMAAPPAETDLAGHANGQIVHDEIRNELAPFAADAAIVAALSGVHSVPEADTPPAPPTEQMITAHPDQPAPPPAPAAASAAPPAELRPTHAPNTTPLASKTPSRPLVDRIRSILQTPALPATATATVVVPRHMYQQHSYSILVRLQYRLPRKPSDHPPTSRPLVFVEVEAPEDAFYLPVHKLALPVPVEGGLSEGTLAITAQRPTPSGADRLAFTFRASDGTILHKGQFVAEITILSPQQMASGNPMLTLVHPLEIPDEQQRA
jgi:hypothetical protein